EQPGLVRLHATMTALRAGVREVAAALADPRRPPSPLPAAAIDAAIDEAVGALLAASAAAGTLDSASRTRLIEHVRASTIHDAALDEELRCLLPALADAGFAPIVIKGAHLAHALYPSPHLRPP